MEADGPKPSCTSHPFVVVFHVLFKTTALLVYLLGSYILSDFVLIFVATVLALAFDFWVVKNVSGRLLVGLRWWNEVTDDGSSTWIFESLSDTSRIRTFDSRLFWVSLFLTPLIWSILGTLALLQLKLGWTLLVIVALVLSAANIIGYLKCAKDARKKLRNMAARFAVRQAAENPDLILSAV